MGVSGSFDVNGGDVSNLAITVTDPAAPTAAPPEPTIEMAIPGDGQVFVMLFAVRQDGVELPTSYRVYWSTSSTFTPGTALGSQTLNSRYGEGMGGAVFSSLSNGTPYYFLATSSNAFGESDPSTIVSATPNPPSGGHSISGTISYSGSHSAPLMVAAVDMNAMRAVFAQIASPTFPQSYNIAGVPDGTYQLMAFIDANHSNTSDVGDVRNDTGTTLVTVNGSNVTSQNLALVDHDIALGVLTGHQLWHGGSVENALKLSLSGALRQPIRITITKGPNLSLPLDLGIDRSKFGLYQPLSTTKPIVGDQYVFDVTYSDGSAATISGSVTAFLETCPTVVSPANNATGVGLTPTFSWSAPSPAPSWFFYDLSLDSSSSGHVCTLEVIDRALTSVPSCSTLENGINYIWSITLNDSAGNSCSQEATFTTQ
jgi:hypothetical protein